MSSIFAVHCSLQPVWFGPAKHQRGAAPARCYWARKIGRTRLELRPEPRAR